MIAAGVALMLMGRASAEGAAMQVHSADFKFSLQSAEDLGTVVGMDTSSEVVYGGRRSLKTTALRAWLNTWQGSQPAEEPETASTPPTPPPPPPPGTTAEAETATKVVTEPLAAAAKEVSVACGGWVTDIDFENSDLTEPGTTTTDQECLDRCVATTGCNGVSRLQSTGGCWIKSLADGYPGTVKAGFNSYSICATTTPPTTATPTPPADATPTPTEFFADDPRSNPHPDSSPHPEEVHIVDETTTPRGIDSVRSLEQGAHAWFDYQVAEGYNPSLGTRVVDRDWFYGVKMFTEASYSICNVNAFQTQADCAECDARPDFTSAWPAQLVTTIEDPESPGQFAIDISTPEKRAAAVAHVLPMIQVCEDKLFDGIEFDNLDAFSRMPSVPYTMDDAMEYAKMLVTEAHNLGLACGQKGAPALFDSPSWSSMGWDFGITYRCGEMGDCAKYNTAFGGVLVGVEYTEAGFMNACNTIGGTAAIVMRDEMLYAPETAGHVMKQCGP